MTDDPPDHAAEIDEWLAFAPDSDVGSSHKAPITHPLSITAIAVGIILIVGLILLRPTGEARTRAEESLSALGVPNDFFAAEVTDVRTAPCDFAPNQDCVTVLFRIDEGPDTGRTYTQEFGGGGTTPDFEVGQTAILSYRAPNARVESVEAAPCDFDASVTCDVVTVAMITSPDLGQLVSIAVPQGVADYAVGTRVEVTFDEAGEVLAAIPTDVASQYQFSDFERRNVLLIVLVLFAAAVIALGRWWGIAALAGLGATLGIVLLWLLPAILDGRSAVLVALVGASAVAYVALYVAHGFNLMTTVALLGTLAALALTALLSWLTVAAARFTGFATEEATLLTLFQGIDLGGLLLAGMVLGAAGALDDVTVTQSSAVWQMRAASPATPPKELLRRGLRIGQHHIGSTVNTLLLAYLGASLPLAILFILSQQSLGSIANSEVVAVEIVRTLVGSIGLVAAVPVTTWLAVRTVTAVRESREPS